MTVVESLDWENEWKLTQVMRIMAYTHIFHSWPSICLVSFQNAPALMDFLPAFLASRNCFDSGKKMRIIPTPMEMPAKRPLVWIYNLCMEKVLTCSPEHRLPTIGSSTNSEVGTGGKDISQGISLLQNARHETTSINAKIHESIGKIVIQPRHLRAMFQSHGDGIPIDTSHEKTK